MNQDLHHAMGQARRTTFSFTVLILFSLFCQSFPAVAGVHEDLALVRNQCLYYAAGHSPTDTNTQTIRHGLYAQSPFSRPGEIDLAASGFSLASLPAAVDNGVISSNAAFDIALEAARQVRSMVTRSASATTQEGIRRYGYGGMLCHYPVWDDQAREFRAQPGVEFSSIDTTLLLYGLMVSANYFEGDVRTEFEGARAAIRWQQWFDTSTRGHRNQVRMSYWPSSGFFGWWDWYTQEAMLVGVLAAMSDDHIDPIKMWQAWRRDRQTYTSPGPDSHSFTCYTTFFGDPFTLIYGQAFLDLSRFPQDIDNQNWFLEAQTTYLANVEFFKKERGFRDDLTAGFSICAPNGVMAKPNGKRLEPLVRTDATLYTLAGGLPYFGEDPASNSAAITLSKLVHLTPGFIGWHGWPAASFNALDPAHPVMCERIIGQDIAFTGLAIDNYLTHRGQNLVLQDPALRRTLNRIFPPSTVPAWTMASGKMDLTCHAVPFTAATLQKASSPTGAWTSITNAAFGPLGYCQLSVTTGSVESFFRLEPEPEAISAHSLLPGAAGPSLSAVTRHSR